MPELGGAFVNVQVLTLDEVRVDELLSGPIRDLGRPARQLVEPACLDPSPLTSSWSAPATV